MKCQCGFSGMLVRCNDARKHSAWHADVDPSRVSTGGVRLAWWMDALNWIVPSLAVYFAVYLGVTLHQVPHMTLACTRSAWRSLPPWKQT